MQKGKMEERGFSAKIHRCPRLKIVTFGKNSFLVYRSLEVSGIGPGGVSSRVLRAGRPHFLEFLFPLRVLGDLPR